MAQLTQSQLAVLEANSLNVSNAISLANQIERDYSVGGIFPNGGNSDFSNPDIEKFKSKYCKWWGLAVILLDIAKTFTGDKGDKAIDALIALGNNVCE